MIVAIPAIIFALVIVHQGGEVWAIGIFALGVVCDGRALHAHGPRAPAGARGLPRRSRRMLVAALYGEPRQVIMVLVASFPVTFFFAVLRPRRENVSWAIAVTLSRHPLDRPRHGARRLAARDLPHGDGLVIDVLVATFLGDTFAYFGGRWFGRTPLAPLISPNKTLEGLVAGVLGATLAFWFAGLYQDWLTGPHALLIGALVAITAPVGDLFESMIKRDLEVKDTGKLFGAHGGVLDRLDAVLFTIPVAYYVAVGLGYA